MLYDNKVRTSIWRTNTAITAFCVTPHTSLAQFGCRYFSAHRSRGLFKLTNWWRDGYFRPFAIFQNDAALWEPVPHYNTIVRQIRFFTHVFFVVVNLNNTIFHNKEMSSHTTIFLKKYQSLYLINDATTYQNLARCVPMPVSFRFWPNFGALWNVYGMHLSDGITSARLIVILLLACFWHELSEVLYVILVAVCRFGIRKHSLYSSLGMLRQPEKIESGLSHSPFRELATRGTSTNQIAASWMLQATWLATVASRHIVWQTLLISL